MKDFLWILGIVLVNFLVYLLFKFLLFWDSEDEETFKSDIQYYIDKGQDPYMNDWIQRQISYKKFVKWTPIIIGTISIIIIFFIILL